MSAPPNATSADPAALSRRERLAILVRWNRRPLVLAAISGVCLALHHVVLRVMAHGRVAQVLLSAGDASPPPRAAVLAIGLVVTRFVVVILVPGLLLAAAAELAAYLLVGPVRAEEADDFLYDSEDA